jgi:hypothetical protein
VGIDIHQARRESEAERARKERDRREATQEDRAKRRALSQQDQVWRFGASEDVGLETDGQRIIVNENIDVGAGKTQGDRPRVLTLTEAMHRLGKITWEEQQAGDALRQRIMALLPHSEGVSSYGLSPGRGDLTTKAARKGRALTGYEVNWRTGQANLAAEELRRHNRSQVREAAELLYAMIGVETEAGRRAFDSAELAMFLVRAVTGNDLTLTEIGKALTNYTGEKQAAAAGGAIIKRTLHRGAVYLGFVKAADWDGKLRWLPG